MRYRRSFFLLKIIECKLTVIATLVALVQEKTIYIDDGSSFADMSSIGRGGLRVNNGNLRRSTGRPTFKECFRTYIEAVKMMVKPMLVTIGFLIIGFLIIYFIL